MRNRVSCLVPHRVQVRDSKADLSVSLPHNGPPASSGERQRLRQRYGRFREDVDRSQPFITATQSRALPSPDMPLRRRQGLRESLLRRETTGTSRLSTDQRVVE